MRISDWSSDVCSSDLRLSRCRAGEPLPQVVDLAREDERREGPQLRGDLRDAPGVAVRRLLLDRQVAPIVEPRDDAGIGGDGRLEDLGHGDRVYRSAERR